MANGHKRGISDIRNPTLVIFRPVDLRFESGLNLPFECLWICSQATTILGALSTDLFGSERSYSSFTGPSITLYDVNGTDITSLYTITQDLPDGVTSTPEPASAVLFGSGLLGMLAVVRRQRTNETMSS